MHTHDTRHTSLVHELSAQLLNADSMMLEFHLIHLVLIFFVHILLQVSAGYLTAICMQCRTAGGVMVKDKLFFLHGGAFR